MGKKRKHEKRPTFSDILLEEKEKRPVFDPPKSDIGDNFVELNEVPLNEKKFKWRFEREFCDLSNKKFGWHKANPEKLFFSALKKLQEYESLTWKEISAKKSAHYHDVPWEKLSESRKKKLSPHIEKGIALCKIAGIDSHRIIGVKLGDTFYPVWNDENHQVYKM